MYYCNAPAIITSTEWGKTYELAEPIKIEKEEKDTVQKEASEHIDKESKDETKIKD